MIHTLLQSITHDLGAFLKTQMGVHEDVVVLSGLMNNADGSFAVEGENKLICTVVNIQRETTVSSFSPMPDHNDRKQVLPPLYINLHVLFSAFYTPHNYVDGLKALSLTLHFFQGKPVFTPANTPSLPNGLDKITVEMQDLDPQHLSNLWAALGAKYMPSVLFKIRMLSITADQVTE